MGKRKTGGSVRIGVSVDLGTTAMAFSLLDLDTGCHLAERNRENPLSVYGVDVLSRLEKSIHGAREKMRELLVETLQACIRDLIGDVFPGKSSLMSPEYVVVTGNTAMLSLLTGQDVRGMEVFPFRVKERFGIESTGLFPAFPDTRVYLPRCVSAFLGADLICALLASRLQEKPQPAILLDIGTNGEIALYTPDRINCSSVPAGPAFEAVHLSCGMQAGPGAVLHVSLQGGIPALAVQDGEAPKGICGSAALDILSLLRKWKLMDSTGQLLLGMDGYGTLVREQNGEKVFMLPGTDLHLSQKDIRALQAAKAAVRAAVETLLEIEGIRSSDIQTVLLAGAFGSALYPESLAGTGLLPEDLAVRCVQIGNAALHGAEEMLLCPKKRDAGKLLAAQIRAVSLMHTDGFAKCYLKYMSFSD
ncbi:MAG: DUF4445 domain-containing protein [Clostridia bacterium]|nr:DUF4445 domain-containing protein [Clostridia bacterium]